MALRVHTRVPRGRRPGALAVGERGLVRRERGLGRDPGADRRRDGDADEEGGQDTQVPEVVRIGGTERQHLPLARHPRRLGLPHLAGDLPSRVRVHRGAGVFIAGPNLRRRLRVRRAVVGALVHPPGALVRRLQGLGQGAGTLLDKRIAPRRGISVARKSRSRDGRREGSLPVRGVPVRPAPAGDAPRVDHRGGGGPRQLLDRGERDLPEQDEQRRVSGAIRVYIARGGGVCRMPRLMELKGPDVRGGHRVGAVRHRGGRRLEEEEHRGTVRGEAAAGHCRQRFVLRSGDGDALRYPGGQADGGPLFARCDGVV